VPDAHLKSNEEGALCGLRTLQDAGLVLLCAVHWPIGGRIGYLMQGLRSALATNLKLL
jgi:hypothetical protein